MADNEILPDQKDPADTGKKADKPKKEKGTVGARFPLLVEFTATLCVIILVIVFMTIVVISLLTGASLLDFLIRTSVSILILGSLLTLIARQISAGMLNAGMMMEGQKQPIEYEEFDMQNPSEAK